MSSVRSLLRASKVESSSIRALFGGIGGVTGALVATSVTDDLFAMVVLVAVLTALIVVVLGLAYNSLATEGTA